MRVKPPGHTPREWGSVKRPDVYLAVANATFKAAGKAIPCVDGMSGTQLIRAVAKRKNGVLSKWSHIRHQMQYPPEDKVPANRFSNPLPSFADFVPSGVAASLNRSARYFGVGVLPLFSEHLKYTAPQLMNLLSADEQEHVENGGVFPFSTLCSQLFLYRFLLNEELKTADVRVESGNAQQFFHDIERDPAVKDGLASMGLVNLAQGLTLLHDHTLGCALSTGICAAQPDTQALMVTSAPGVVLNEAYRSNLVIFGEAKKWVQGIEALDRLVIYRKEGKVEVESAAVSSHDLDLPHEVIALPEKAGG